MNYNEDVQSLLDKIESIISKDYDEQLHLISINYQEEIIRLNVVIEAYREVATKAQKDADGFEKENKRLVAWIDTNYTLK